MGLKGVPLYGQWRYFPTTTTGAVIMGETPHSTFRLSAEVRAMLDEMADARGVSRTAIVEMAVREWYDSHPRWRKGRRKIREAD